MTDVTILGAGAWGTALACHLSKLPDVQRVRLWTWQASHAEELRGTRHNPFLAGVSLPENIEIYAELGPALAGAEVALLVVPSTAMRETLIKAAPHLGTASVVSATKGIEVDSLMLMGEVVIDVCGPQFRDRFAVLSGPSFAREVAAGLPTTVVVASKSDALAKQVQRDFSGENFRVYASDDPAGVEVGGALKNVIAIAAGASDGLGFGHNARAALITRGVAEIARLAKGKGGDPASVSGLAGVGDLVLTCTGEQSRNRTVGVEVGRGRALADVLEELGHVAEGVPTAKSAYRLAQQLGVDLPICTAVYRALFEGQPAAEVVAALLSRPLRRERE